MIETQLNGMFPPDYVIGDRVNLSALMRSAGPGASPPSNPPVQIRDARPVQAAAVSERAFFDEHGFVLLHAPTAMKDWGDREEVSRVYMAEVDALIRNRIFPGRALSTIQPPTIGRRGAGTDNPNYATGVHQDHGLTADDYQNDIQAYASPEAGAHWRKSFERPEVDEFVVLDFWRTTNMDGPLKHMPLALCDPSSVDPADIVPTALEGLAPSGKVTHHIGPRFNPRQKWFYYPDMTPDEVLVFTLFRLRAGSERFRSCFHTAFADPTAPADAPPRQSCEHRVGVTLMN